MKRIGKICSEIHLKSLEKKVIFEQEIINCIMIRNEIAHSHVLNQKILQRKYVQ